MGRRRRGYCARVRTLARCMDGSTSHVCYVGTDGCSGELTIGMASSWSNVSMEKWTLHSNLGHRLRPRLKGDHQGGTRNERVGTAAGKRSPHRCIMSEGKVLAARESASLAKKAAEAAAAVAAGAMKHEQQHEDSKGGQSRLQDRSAWHRERNRKCQLHHHGTRSRLPTGQRIATR
jgi:hypothetical protein